MSAIPIRPATPADAPHLVCFVDMASEGLALKIWDSLRTPHQVLTEFGRSRAMREEGAFSYVNGHVAEVDGAIAGGLVGYVIEPDHDISARMPDPAEAAKVPAFLHPVIELERLVPHHWYINVIATYPEFRGRGVGAALLTHAETLARTADATGMALIVDVDNGAALRAYERAGYAETARRPLVPFAMRPDGGHWLLMTKPLG